MTEIRHFSFHTTALLLSALYRSLLCLAGATALVAALLFCGIGQLMPHFHNLAQSTVSDGEAQTASDVLQLFPSVGASSIDAVAEPEDSNPSNLPRISIATRDLRAASSLALRNETSYMPDLKALLSVSASQIDTSDTAPTVLILHTHATESYASGKTYTSQTSFRSVDPQRNMIAIGETVAEVLRERGFHVIHCTEQHDAVSFNAAYDYSAASVRQALRENPEINYILDIHRDAIEGSDGNVVRCATEINGKSCAQMMLVVGTDEGGAQHPFWRKNLTFALALQSYLCNTYPGLMRQINLRKAAFNQQYSAGYLLLEVGSSGNTLQEAKEAARLFAIGFAEVTDPRSGTA